MSCTIAPDSAYSERQSELNLLSFIPFIGPSLSPLIPSVPNHSEDLKKVQAQLKTATENWQNAITNATATNAQQIRDMLELFTGGDGYVTLVAKLVNEPTEERSIINAVNIIFLSIIVSIIIYYIIISKHVNAS